MSDLDHWNLVTDLSLHEAAALAAGIDPTEGWKNGEVDHVVGTIFHALSSAYLRQVKIYCNAASWAAARDPSDFKLEIPGDGSSLLASKDLLKEIDLAAGLGAPANWAKITEELEDVGSQRFDRTELGRWFRSNARGFRSKYDFDGISEKPDEAPSAKPLTTNERNTLLTIIATLCDYSAIDLDARGVATQVAKLTEEFGTPVSDDTIRKVLTQIRDALESRRK